MRNAPGAFAYFIEWKIDGGRFVLSDGSKVTSICFGDANNEAKQNESLCFDGLDFLTFGSNNSSITSSVMVQWDSKPSTTIPKVTATLKTQSSIKRKYKVKTKFGSFNEFTTSGKFSDKEAICKKEMNLGADLIGISSAQITTNCSSGGSRNVTINPGLTYDGCLNPGIDFAYEYRYRLNGGSLTAPKYVYSKSFTIPSVKPTDELHLEVTPYMSYGFRGTTYKTSVLGARTAVLGNVPAFIYTDKDPASQEFRVYGLNNIQATFSPTLLNSPIYLGRSQTNSTISFYWKRSYPPTGSYTITVTGTDKVCGTPVQMSKTFQVVKGAGLRGPIFQHNSATDSLGVSAHRPTSRSKDQDNTNIAIIRDIPIDFSVYPNPVKQGQAITITYNEEYSKDATTSVNAEIFDQHGRKVLNHTELPRNSQYILSTEALERGWYSLRLSSPQNIISIHRFLVQ